MPSWLLKADPKKTLVRPKRPRKLPNWILAKASKRSKNTYSQVAKRLPDWLLRAKPSANIKRPPWLQKGKGLSDVAKTVANNPYFQEVSKKIISKGINSIPSLFKRGTKNVKNNRLKRVLQSDIAIDLVNRGTQRLHGGL